MKLKKHFLTETAKSDLVFVISLLLVSAGALMAGYSLRLLNPGEVYADMYPGIDSVAQKIIVLPDEAITPAVSSAFNKASYPVYPDEGDYIGRLSIPSIGLDLPFFQGTSERELNKGAGHYIQSVLPGEEDNCILSGHREFAFRKLGDIRIGETVNVQTLAGIFTYRVSRIRVVNADDTTVITPSDHAMLTLTTCFPFVYIGSAPYRYIVTADMESTE